MYSDGFKRYRDDIKMAKERAASPEQFLEMCLESFRRNAPDMTDNERQSVVDRQAAILYEFNKGAVRLGISVPGNGPSQPNWANGRQYSRG